MLKLKELRFSGIGRFVEEQVINFENLGSLIQVDGENKNTGGSSGAGKSTVFNALDYLLGLNDVPNTILQSRITKEGINVSALFDLDGKALKLSKNKGKLLIDLEGELTTGSSKISEEKLDQLLSIPRHLFRPMLHKRQREGGFFLNFTPKEINDFLTDCLGLSDYKKKLEILDRKIKEVSDKKLSTSQSLSYGRSGLKATQDAMLALGLAPIKDIHQEVVLHLKGKMESSNCSLVALLSKQKLETEGLDLERPYNDPIVFDSSHRVLLEEQLTEVRNKASNLLFSERDRQGKVKEHLSSLRIENYTLSEQIKARDSAKPEAAKIALQIKKIRESQCPTCLQGWATEAAKAEENALLQKLSNYKAVIELGDLACQKLVSITVDIQNLTATSAPLVPEGIQELQKKEKELQELISNEHIKQKQLEQSVNAANASKQSEFAIKQRTLREQHSRESEQSRGQAEVDRRAFDAAVSKLRAYEEARLRYESTLNNLQVQEKNYFTEIERHSINEISLAIELDMAEELKKAVKSYLSCSFDDALDSIGNTATRIIRNIPNMANATIQLEGIKETKEGKVKEEVNAVIHMDGEEAIPIKSLSGGERSATDLAVDLAVIDLIENKTNKGIDIFILDEPFTGLDTPNIEMALEVLRNCNINKRLVVVDHNPVIKEQISDKILVQRNGEISKITK